MDGGLAAGVYESLHTRSLDRQLAGTPELTPRFSPIAEADAPEVLARHVAAVVRRLLADERDPERRATLIRELLTAVEATDDLPTAALEQLLVLTREEAPGVHRLIRPETPLSTAALLTNAKGEPSLGAELRAELSSADQVDLLCAFIRWTGLRVLEEPLALLKEHGIPLRVITTTYVGATERRAVDEMVRRFGAAVRISYETQSTRLHAKAWLFRRRSGFDTAFIGSSNLSRAALLDGLEWNVRLSGVATPELLRKFAATFDTYWADQTFVSYNPDIQVDVDRLDDGLRQAGTREGRSTITLAGLEVRPLPHQVSILEALDAERQIHGRHRNLVVAATGTGKTVVAALDYRRLCEQQGRDLSVLFVAHRREILDQSLRTYRETMSDGAFGEAYVGGARPERWRHVFASVQSLASYGVDRLPPDHFDVVVVDEFHHAAAKTYQQLLEHLQPLELLGLTATPERGDGVDVRGLFGGRTAYELRLWDALAADLLVPFHYFGIADDVDLTSIEWKRGAYDLAALDRVYTGNDARAAKVLKELADKVTDVGRMRALGFCVSVAHAVYMARVFQDAGIPSLAVSGQSTESFRADGLEQLRNGTVNCLFAADLFNEGLDLPAVDTILLLRPTQSATIFLQQLGRGLRRSYGKPVLTVLDLIGQHRREFRFDARYRALTGTSRKTLVHQIEQGFPFLPSGSQLILDRVAQGIVLDNVRRQLQLSRKDLVADLRSYGDLHLATYLEEAGRDLADIYKSKGSWTALRREAGLATPTGGHDEVALLRRMSALAHVDDPERAAAYTKLTQAGAPAYEALDDREQRLARMLFFTLWPNKGGFSSYEEGLRHLRQHPAAGSEIRELVALGLDRARHLPHPLGEGLQQVPLASHAHYRREEILAALGWATMERSARGNITGVAWAEETQTDALMVNLRKSEKDFSPTTMYRDYAISRDLFHWESQNATSTMSAAGKRYLDHSRSGSRVVLFVRETPEDDVGAAPFLCLGQAFYVEHRGEKPIAITWRLHREMPGDVFRQASVVAS
jgi:superfamily II DNA or RNA helicase/HKD family nuclease